MREKLHALILKTFPIQTTPSSGLKWCLLCTGSWMKEAPRHGDSCPLNKDAIDEKMLSFVELALKVCTLRDVRL